MGRPKKSEPKKKQGGNKPEGTGRIDLALPFAILDALRALATRRGEPARVTAAHAVAILVELPYTPPPRGRQPKK